MVSAAVAGTTFRPAPSYTTLWDVAQQAAENVKARAGSADVVVEE